MPDVFGCCESLKCWPFLRMFTSGYDTGSMVTGLIAPGDVARLAALANVNEVAAPPELRPKLDNTVAEMRVPWKVPPTTPWPGKGTNVIVAVIDTGIDIFHDSFRKSDGTTRILELWDQSVTSPAHPPPPGLTQVGAVFNAGHINAGLTAGAPFLSRDTIGHGTHVAGIAAGNGRQDDRCTFPGAFVGVAPEADLVIVRGGGAAADAFAWCAAAGARHPMADGRPRRGVINFSLGGDLGPHDGTGDLSLLLGPILRPAAGIPPGLAIVAAAGNEGNYEHHESGTIPPNGTVTVPFYVPENSMTADDLEIWYNGTATLNVQITAPADPTSGGTNTTGVVTPGAPGSPFTIGAMTLTVTSSVGARAQNNSKKRIQVDFAFPATTSLRSGLWQLALTETAGVQADWGAWFQPQLTDKFPVFKLPTDPEHTERRRLNTISDPGSALDTHCGCLLQRP
jgi:subtilisin family serine protease